MLAKKINVSFLIFGFILIILAAFYTTANINAEYSNCGEKSEITVESDGNCLDQLYADFGGKDMFNLTYVYEVTGVSTGKEVGK